MGGTSIHLEVQRENELQIEIEKEKKDPVMDESILSDIVLTSPFLQNSNSLMTRIRPGGIGTLEELNGLGTVV